MNRRFFEVLEGLKEGVIAVVLNTEGHTYKKRGDKVIFERNNPFPVYESLGMSCAEQEINEVIKNVIKTKKWKILKIKGKNYETYCEGEMEILVLPVNDRVKKVFREIKEFLSKGKEIFLIYDFKNMRINIKNKITDSELQKENLFVEKIFPYFKLFIFGANPLANHVINYARDLYFDIYLIDYRRGYLDLFKNYKNLTLLFDKYPFDNNSFVIALSHTAKDKEVLKKAIERKCIYIGLLASEKRRNKIFKELIKEGFSQEELKKIKSPIGIPVGSKTDPEIAISIIAEIIKICNSHNLKIAGVLLAAGKSERFGENKLLYTIKDKPLIFYTLKNILQSSLPEIYIVLGEDSERIKEIIKNYFDDKRIKFLINKNSERGLMSSLKIAIKEIKNKFKGIIVFLADMPLIKKEIIEKLINEFYKNPDKIIIPECGGNLYHPRIIPEKFFEHFLNLKNFEKGLKVINKFPDKILKVKIGEKENFIDIDKREDIEKVIFYLKKRV